MNVKSKENDVEIVFEYSNPRKRNKGESLSMIPSSYVVVDVETTGLDPYNDSLIEVAAIKVHDGKIVDEFSSLINPQMLINDFITNLTGITNQNLSDAPLLDDILPRYMEFISDYIVVGHNVHFDINFLYDNAKKMNGYIFNNDFVDTLRLSRKYLKHLSSHSLESLLKHFNIDATSSHRALSDCKNTIQLLDKLKECEMLKRQDEEQFIKNFIVPSENEYKGKRVVVKGTLQLYSFDFMESISEKCGATFGNIFYEKTDILVLPKYTYKRYLAGEDSLKFHKANYLFEEKGLKVLSEADFYKSLGIPLPKDNSKNSSSSGLSAKDIVAEVSEFDETHPLFNKVCVFTGTLQNMQRKEAMQIVANLGGINGDGVTKKTNYLILGNNDYCSSIKDGKSSKQKKAEELKLKGQEIEIISENVFYDMISE